MEASASLGATVARVLRALKKGEDSTLQALVKSPSQLTAEVIVAAARQGDALAKMALLDAGEALGFGIVNAVQLLNPSLVVLAGKFANAASDFLLEAVTRTIQAQCFETTSRSLEIRVAPLRKDAGPVGCALLASLDVAAELIQTSLFKLPS